MSLNGKCRYKIHNSLGLGLLSSDQWPFSCLFLVPLPSFQLWLRVTQPAVKPGTAFAGETCSTPGGFG